MIQKVLILGITGTLGHKIAQVLGNNKNFIISGTYNDIKKIKKLKYFIKYNKIYKASDVKSIVSCIKKNKFDYVINCVGIIKQKKNIKSQYFNVNKILPLKISKLTDTHKFKFIHFSTDCVFDGKKGNYKEEDLKNAKDYYGISKSEGEPSKYNQNCLTFRTSFIGHEIFENFSLLNWFINTDTKVNGFYNCLFNGLTNFEISKIIFQMLLKKEIPYGIYHLSGKKVNKYSLLKIINKVYFLNKIILKKNNPIINRTLNNNKFRKEFLYTPKDWKSLIRELYLDFQLNKDLYNF